MSEGLDIIYNYFFNPGWSIRRITETKPYHLGLIILMLVIVSNSTADNLMNNMGGRILGFQLTIFFLGWLILNLVMIFFFAAVYHYIASAFGSSGSTATLYILLCMANIPYLLTAPLAMIMNQAGDAGKFCYSLSFFLLFIWYIYLVIISLKEQYKFSTGKAVTTFFLWICINAAVLLIIFVGIPLGFIISLFI